MSNDAMDIFTQIVQDTDNKRQRKIENYINAAVEEMSESIKKALYVKTLFADPEVKEELERWAEMHRHDFAFGLTETARVLLHRELLEDK